MQSNYDLAVVGAGIVGLAHAWSAAKRGQRVAVFERSPRPRGASIRNFGMIWPIGQPAGRLYETALASRALWLQLSESSGIWANPCGSIHLAHQEDEWHVLQEFASTAHEHGYECELLSREDAVQRSPAANGQGLLGGLWSPTELCVDPRQALARLPHWLAETHQVACHFSTTISAIEGNELAGSDGRRWRAERIVVCGGDDFQTLYPEILARSGLVKCKLQMMRTVPQDAGFRIGPHLAGGLTLRHYRSFENCPSLAALKDRIARQTPELDEYGIHVMAAQNELGEVVLGDSHEYGDRIEPFDKPQIDELVLRELRRIIRLQDWTIAARWHGVYARHPTLDYFRARPSEAVTIIAGIGGMGMTISFGTAEATWGQW